jgi:flagellar assembly protein FliH
MASVIKSGRVIPSGTAVQHSEFNFEDMSENATKYLDSVKQKAAEIVHDAQKQSQNVREQAARQGQASAEQAAKEAALQHAAAQWKSLAPALQQAIDETAAMRAGWVRQWESNIVQLVIAIARQVIRKELSCQPQITEAWIREALDLASGAPSITLQLNPDDYEALGEQRESIRQHFGQMSETHVVADPAISRGGCRVVTDYGRIDQQLETQLERIQEELNL